MYLDNRMGNHNNKRGGQLFKSRPPLHGLVVALLNLVVVFWRSKSHHGTIKKSSPLMCWQLASFQKEKRTFEYAFWSLP